MKRVLALMSPLLLIAAAPNWVASVRVQPANGAFLMGNPAAKVKLVEYLSYTCSHCAEFTSEAKVALKRDHVAKGTVSVELRNAVRDRFDFAAALLARCGGPAKFFGNTEAIFAAQATWLGKAGAVEQANADKLAKLPIDDSLKLIARGVGLDAIMKTRGFTSAQVDACLIDKAAQDRIVKMTNEAWNVRKINGTPAFLINGTATSGVGHWNQLEPLLRRAAG